MKRLLSILILMFSVAYVAEAQLLEDNDSRLKTGRIVRNKFLFFKAKKAPQKSDGIPSSRNNANPRYSNISSPFRLNRGTSPRYSSAKVRQGKYSSSPRYSRTNTFRSSDFRVSPRYSKSNPFRGSDTK